MVGFVRFDVPFVFLDLGGDPLLPTATDDVTFLSLCAPQARAEAVGCVRPGLRRIEIQVVAKAFDRLLPTAVRELHRRFRPAVEFKCVNRRQRDKESAAALTRLFRSTPDAVGAVTMSGGPS
jgi:hypothetical protein